MSANFPRYFRVLWSFNVDLFWKKNKVSEGQLKKMLGEEGLNYRHFIDSYITTCVYESLLIRHFCTKTKTIMFPHPSYSYNLADFILFPKLEIWKIKIRHIKNIKESSWTDLRTILKNAYQDCKIMVSNITTEKKHISKEIGLRISCK